MKNREQQKERLLELLADEVLFGLNDQESIELQKLQIEFPEFKNDNSFEKTATAIGITNIDTKTEMPHNLQVKVLADADKFFNSTEKIAKNSITSSKSEPIIETEKPKTPFWQWLTPAFAGIGCLALIGNIWITYNRNQEIVQDKKSTPTIEKARNLTTSEQRQKLLASATDIIKTNWTSPTNDENLKGEVVWSDKKQEGYMTFKGLAKNDADKETYQLWIFRDEKLEPHPIDGGIFDVTKDGEIIVPIDAKLEVKKPKVFAITIEKPGGVVVSKRGKLPALAKVTT